MATFGAAVPGTVVSSGAFINPGGAQGPVGPTGPSGSGGGAGTKTVARFSANDANPTVTNYGVWATRNQSPILTFNQTTSWSSFFVGCIPEGAVLSSGLTVNIWWAAGGTATSGNVKWNVQFERFGSTTISSDSYDTLATVTTACSGTNGVAVKSSITPITTIDGLTIGDPFRMIVTRDTTAGSNLAADAQIIEIEVRTAN